MFEDSWFVGRLSRRDAWPNVPKLASEKQRVDTDFNGLHIEVVLGGVVDVAINNDANVTAIVHGYLLDVEHRSPAQYLLRQYLVDRDSLWKRVNGSMVAMILDGRRHEVLVTTDRVNSRKVFASNQKDGWWLTTSLYRHPTDEFGLDPVAIGSILTSGVAHDRLSPFRGIETLPRASVTTFDGHGCRSEAYWSYSFTGDNAHTSREDLSKQMSDVLRRAVQRRVESVDGLVYISLSGGHDSKSVAAFVKETVEDPQRLRSFTYHHGQRIGDTDAAAAEQAASWLGIPHEQLSAYEGDLTSLIDINAQRGQGMARYCEEAKLWESFGPRLGVDESNALFVGDMFYNRPHRRSGDTPADVLGLVDIHPPDVADWFLERLEPGSRAAIREGWGARYERLMDRVPTDIDPRDAQEILYLDQRVASTLMLWRECFQMPHVRVMNPYLDNEVLDFVSSLPTDLRDQKALYKESIALTFPGLSQLPLAKGGWNAPLWSQELLRSKSAIREIVTTRPSLLDDLISPEMVLSLFEDASKRSTADSLSSTVKHLAKRSAIVRRAVRRVKADVMTATPKHTSWDTLLLRLLLLRESLSTLKTGA